MPLAPLVALVPLVCSRTAAMLIAPCTCPCTRTLACCSHRYLSFIEDRPKKGAPLFAVLRDASGAVLSVSPVINAEACKVSAATHNILIEVSGAESLELVQQVGSQFLEVFAKAHAAAAAEQGGTAAGAQQLCVAPVRLLTVGTGHVRAIWPRP